MGLLDDIAGFGNSFANSYFNIGSKLNAERKAEQGLIADSERNRDAIRKNDYGDLLFEAQQDYPEFFDLLAGQTAEDARNKKETSARSAGLMALHSDPEFLSRFQGIEPGSPEFQQEYARALAERGYAPEAIKEGTTATASERKLMAQLMAIASTNPDLVDEEMIRTLAERNGLNGDAMVSRLARGGDDAIRPGETAEDALNRMYNAQNNVGGSRLNRNSLRALVSQFDPTNAILKDDPAAQKNLTAILQQLIRGNDQRAVQGMRGATSEANNMRTNATRQGIANTRASAGQSNRATLFGGLDISKIAGASPELAGLLAQSAAARIKQMQMSGMDTALDPVDMVFLQFLAKKGGIDPNTLLQMPGAPTPGKRQNLFAPASGKGRTAPTPTPAAPAPPSVFNTTPEAPTVEEMFQYIYGDGQ